MIKNIIAIYPGRFQPFGKHHANAFKWLQQQFGQPNAFVVTSDKVDPPKSPFNFQEKKQIVSQYGFNNIVQVKNPYKAEELMKNFNPEDTAVVFMVGSKDMQEDPRFKIGTKKDGSPSYFQSYKDNKGNLQGFDKHGYLITAPHISIAIPGYGEMSGTELRNVLGTKTVSRDEKAKIFKDIFGWYNKSTADMIFDKLEPLTESVLTKDWWKNIFESIDKNEKTELTESQIFDKIKAKIKDIVKKVKQENSETKEAFITLVNAAKGDIKLSDADKTKIGDQMKDVLKMLGLATIAIAPGGSIAAVLIKLFKQEHLITPSAFVNEIDTIDHVEENLAPISTLQSIANKHKISIQRIKDQLKQGLEIEKERTKNVTMALNTALQRIFKDPNYYVKLKILNLENTIKTSLVHEIGDASAKVYPFKADADPSKLVDNAKKYHETNTSHTYYETKLAYKFKTDKANYIVNFAVSMERKRYINFTGAPNFKPGPPYDTYVEVGFNIDGDTEERTTNLNEQFSVLSTVTKIIFDFIDKLNKANGNLIILYIGAKNDTDSTSKLDSKRGKLYAAYLKKNLSKLPGYGAKEQINSDGNEYIQIYKKGGVNEISLSKQNAAKLNGDLTGGTFTVGDITYEYSIKNVPNPYKNDLGLFYNIQFTPSGEVTSIPKGGKENYIKILSTMYKIIVDFIEKEQPTYVGIASLDNSRDKNYHAVYDKLTSKHMDIIPGYVKKDSNLAFDSRDGKGKYIVLKKKGSLDENKSKNPYNSNAYVREFIQIYKKVAVTEVGEASASKYKWEEIDREAYSIYTEFKTESDTKYFIDITTDKYKNIPIFTVEFSAKTKGAEGSSSKVVTNKGEMYKVMATIVDIIKTYLKKSKKIQGVAYYPSKKGNEDFGIQRDKLYKAFISKAVPGAKFEPIKNSLYGDGTVALMPSTNVTEGYMGAEQTKKHNAKLAKLKQFLDANIGREFVYDFDMYPKTVVGVGIQEGVLNEGGAAGHMAHPFNIDWVKNGKDLLEVFKMAVEYLKNGPGAVKIDGLNASIRLIELDNKKQFVLDRGSQKDLDVRGITKADLLDRFGEGHGMIQVGGKVLDIFNNALNATTTELKQLGLWNDPNIMFNLEYVSGTSNVIEYGNNFLAIHGLLEITRQSNAKTGKPGARVTTEVSYNEDVMQNYIDKLAVFAQKEGYEVVGSVPTEMKSEPNFTKVLSEKVAVNYGNGKTETKTLSQWLSIIKVPENQTVKLSNGKTVNPLSKAVLNAVLDGTPLNEFVANEKDIPLVIDGAITYIATAKLGDEVLKNLDSKLGSVSDHEGVVIRDERIYDKPFKLTGQFIITGQTSQFQTKQ